MFHSVPPSCCQYGAEQHGYYNTCRQLWEFQRGDFRKAHLGVFQETLEELSNIGQFTALFQSFGKADKMEGTFCGFFEPSTPSCQFVNPENFYLHRQIPRLADP